MMGITCKILSACFFLLLFPGVLWAQEKVPLYIYSATDLNAIESLIERFEEQYPSIDVIYREYNSNELFQEVLKNRDNPNYPGDIIISSAMDLQVKLVNEGMASAYQSAYSGDMPDWAQWRNELYGFTFEPAVIAYNKKAFEGRELPASHSELAGMIRDAPEFFRGRIGTYDIRKSGIGYLYATQDSIQSTQIFRLTESLGRAEARIFCCTSQMLDEIASGRLVLGYNLIGSYALAAARQDDRIGVHFARDYTMVMARTAFILKSSRHRDEAMEYIEFLLSKTGQKILAANTSLIPLNRNIKTSLSPYLDQSSFLPIKLGIGLLAYLDRLKKKDFLESWESSINWRRSGR